MPFTSDHAVRVQRRLRSLYDRARYRLGLPEPDAGSASCAAGFRHPIADHQRGIHPAGYRALFPAAVRAELEEAARLAAHSFTFLGQTVTYGDRIAWSRDPISGREWSRGFSPRIPYRGPGRLGDVKLPWELNKHQYFFTLGKAAWLSDDPAFAVEIVRQIDHWISDNPYRRGVNWISALEVGTRAVSWILAFPFYAGHGDAAFRERLARSLAQHMTFVYEHRSAGRYANNHLIGDSASLVAGGLFLDHRHSAKWVDTGVAHLEAEMQRQVTPDGVHAERSISYHRFVLDQYHLVNVLLTRNGRAFSDATLTGMERMTGFLMDVLAPDGGSPSIGDGDDARGIWLRAGCPADYRSPLALGAVLFKRPDFKAIAGGLPEDVFWLFGEEGVRAFQELSDRPPNRTSVAYPAGGYYVMRSGWSPADAVLVFDCGPVGHGTAGHGHADTLSVQLHAAGYPFLVDPGAFSYNLDYDWRHAFRSTRAHNTIVVDGEDQSIPADRMAWSHMAQARPRRWVSTRAFDLADGEHDGYARLSDPVLHRRVVVSLKPDAWIICDDIGGEAAHALELLLHLRPDCDVQCRERDPIVLQAPNGSRLTLSIAAGREPVAPSVLVGTDTERAAWFSPGYGTRVPSRALSVRRQFVGRTSLVSCLSASSVMPAASFEDGVLTVRLLRDRNEDILSYRVHETGAIERRGTRFDGSLLFTREYGGVPAIIHASDFRTLSIAGCVEVSSRTPVTQLDYVDGRCEITADGAEAVHVDAGDDVTVVVNGVPRELTARIGRI